MESENTMVNNTSTDTGTVDSGPNETQVKEKMFSQEELDNILQKRLSQATKKFADIDVDVAPIQTHSHDLILIAVKYSPIHRAVLEAI